MFFTPSITGTNSIIPVLHVITTKTSRNLITNNKKPELVMFGFCGSHEFQFLIPNPKKAIPFFLFPLKLNIISKNNSRLKLKKISQLKWLNVYLKSNIPKTNDLLDCIWLVKTAYFQNALFDTIILSEKPMKIWFFHALAGQIHQTHIHDLVLEAVVFLKKKRNFNTFIHVEKMAKYTLKILRYEHTTTFLKYI